MQASKDARATHVSSLVRVCRKQAEVDVAVFVLRVTVRCHLRADSPRKKTKVNNRISNSLYQVSTHISCRKLNTHGVLVDQVN